MKKTILLFMIMSMIAFLAACGSNSADKEDKQDTQKKVSQKVEISKDEKIDNKKTVLKVNGAAINGREYNTVYKQTKTIMNRYGNDVKDLDKVKERTMEVLIQQALVKDDAKKEGLKISDKKVDKKFNLIKKKHPDQLKKVMDQYGFTEKQYKEQLAFESTLSNYIDKKIEKPKVSNKDVKTFYDTLKKRADKMPDYKDIKDSLKKQLVQQKQEKLLQDKIKKMKKDAKIEKLV